VTEGQQVRLKIISLDSERHRLGLSLKQAEERPAPPPREERPRRETGQRRDRRDRFDYRPEDATAEPEGGIDNTMAAAFASSGLLDQFRSSDEAPASSAAPDADGSSEAAAEAVDASTEPTEAEVAEAPAASEEDEATTAAEETSEEEAARA
jgi:hypothetical protein